MMNQEQRVDASRELELSQASQPSGAVTLSKSTFLRRRARRAARGVTLVEVLIVVAIMAMLAGGVAFALFPRFQEASIKTAKENAIKLRQAVALWRTDNPGDCPTVGRLKTDKLLDKVGGDDPWGKSYTIKCADGEVYVESKGPDQKSGTEDDIVVPNEKDNSDEEK